MLLPVLMERIEAPFHDCELSRAQHQELARHCVQLQLDGPG
jgi:hypothetical protein